MLAQIYRMKMTQDYVDTIPEPAGKLALQMMTMPQDTNSNGDIFGGWLMSQMDLAGAILARETSRGRVATVAVSEMVFLRPVKVGATISCYSRLEKVGRTSMRIVVDVWQTTVETRERYKVTEGEFVYVAMDPNGHSRTVQKS